MNWALIAGGSKGLGLSIAKKLALRKYNLILIARNQQDLISSRDQLQYDYGILVEILACDLSQPESSTAILEFCTDKDFTINILCNAAGLGGAKDFQNLELNELRAMIRTNLESCIALCFVLLPFLKQSAPSCILNIGSLAGFAPIPVKSVYASSKSALHSFSYALRNICRPFRVSVTLACPGPLFTKKSIEEETIRQLGWLGKQIAVKPDDAAELIVRAMLKGKMTIVPGKLAKLVSYLLRMTPNGPIARLQSIFQKK
jgi:uncharacterized protein